MPSKKKSTKKSAVVAKSFEEATGELDEITSRLEQDPNSLDELLADFERGQELLDYCRNTLNSAKKRLTLIEAKIDSDPSADEEEESPPPSKEDFFEADSDPNDDNVRLL